MMYPKAPVCGQRDIPLRSDVQAVPTEIIVLIRRILRTELAHLLGIRLTPRLNCLRVLQSYLHSGGDRSDQKESVY